MTAPVLRPYQVQAIADLEAAPAMGHRRVILVAATGSGKTVIAAGYVRRKVDEGARVLFLAHRRELIHQAANKLFAAGLDVGVILAGQEMRLHAPVQVASISTLWHRGIRSSTIDMPPADVVVIDECHHARARTYEAIIEQYPGAQIVGLTATPCRGDGRGLGNTFDALVHCPSVRELIALGNLVQTVVYAPTRPDLKGVRVRQGDYVESELAARVDKAKLIGDIVEHWGKYAADRQTLAFAVGIQHSVHIRDEFRRAGVAAEHIDGSTPNDEREAILRGLANGSVRVVSNVGIATEGFDCPDVGAVVLARPTKSLGLYRQMVGRALRPTPGKENAVILDHAGAVFEHGLAEDDIDWTLETDRRAENVSQAKRGGKGERRLVTCPECGAVRWSGPVCHACGYRPKPKPRSIDFVDGSLERVDGKGKANGHTAQDKRRWYAELTAIAEDRGYKPGWVAHKFKEKFGDWPPRFRPEPAEPSVEVLGWVRSRNIAWAKARDRNVQ